MATFLNAYARSMGCPNQDFIAYNTTQMTHYVQSHIKQSDIYLSVYAFDRVPDGKIDRESARIDKVFFDLDPDLTDHWFVDMMRMHAWCESRDILHRCHFSGNGAHVFIFTTSNILHKREAIGNFQRWLAKDLDLHLDKRVIGDTSRICRYPNSYNFKGRRYCIPLPQSVLNPKLTIDWIYQHATRQLFADAWCGHKLLNLQIFDVQDRLYTDSNETDVDLQAINPNVSIDYPQFPACVQTWLSTPLLPDEGKFLLTLYLKDQLKTICPFDVSEIRGILQKVLSPGEYQHWFGRSKGDLPRRHPGHSGIKFKAVIQHDYYLPSCSELQQKGYCKSNCGRGHPIYD
jgi:hypothetical protein